MYTDTHCHIYKEYYKDITNILNNAKNVGILKVINNGCDNKSNKEVIKLASIYPNMYCAIGIHPEYAETYNEKDIQFIEQNLTNKKVIAIGEIGLDYHYTKENKENQIKLFEAQLSLAENHQIPVIIHSREATNDTINTLKKYHVKGIIHSFSGSLETANEYIKMGFLLGINGVITFKNSKLKDVIKEIDLRNIVLETDSPYLTPEPLRGKQNNPANITHIANFLCNLKNISNEELSTITNNNLKNLFKNI